MQNYKIRKYMSCLMTKPTKWLHARRRLRSAWASAQSDQSSLCNQWVAKDPSFLHADREDSHQTGRIPRLKWVFAGRTYHSICLVMRQLNSDITSGASTSTLCGVTRNPIASGIWLTMVGLLRTSRVTSALNESELWNLKWGYSYFTF